MSDEHLALLPLSGAGKTHCDSCTYLGPKQIGPRRSCKFPWALPYMTIIDGDERDPRCISAERAAATLRLHRDRLAAAVREYLAADDALAEASAESETGDESDRVVEALDALRAALKEVPHAD